MVCERSSVKKPQHFVWNCRQPQPTEQRPHLDLPPQLLEILVGRLPRERLVERRLRRDALRAPSVEVFHRLRILLDEGVELLLNCLLAPLELLVVVLLLLRPRVLECWLQPPRALMVMSELRSAVDMRQKKPTCGGAGSSAGAFRFRLSLTTLIG